MVKLFKKKQKHAAPLLAELDQVVAVSTNLYFDGTFLYCFCLAWFSKNASLQQTTVSYCQQSFIFNVQLFDNPASPEAASGSPSSDVLRGVASH